MASSVGPDGDGPIFGRQGPRSRASSGNDTWPVASQAVKEELADRWDDAAKNSAFGTTVTSKRRRIVGEVGEVWFTLPASAHKAVEAMDGSSFGGSILSVKLILNSDDELTVVVYGLPQGIGQQQLKDHFAKVAPVLSASVSSNAGLQSAAGRLNSKGTGRSRGGTLAASDVEVEYDSAGMLGKVRYDDAKHAQRAIDDLHGSTIREATISVEPDTCSDGTKLVVKGLPLDINWQELKDHFSLAGPVAFANIGPPSAPVDMRNAAVDGGVGEVRYDSPADTRMAMMQLHGSTLHGYQLSLQLDATSKDGTKLIVYGIAPGVEWQEMKDHFGQIGVVAYANVNTRTLSSKGTGKDVSGGSFRDDTFNIWGDLRYKGAKGANFPTKGYGGKGFGPPAPLEGPSMMQRVGEVRFDHLGDAERAAAELDGSILGGVPVQVRMHLQSKDRSKCIVHGIPYGIEWQELKDHFSTVGQVAFANITTAPVSAGASSMQWQHAPPGEMPASRAVGEVRFDDPMDAPRAVAEFNGAEVAGIRLLVERAPMSQDGAKILVRNLPPGFKWQELKDLFGQIGSVAFVDIKM
mmetsp:Transcript_5415/g.10174  ORF Transcript_5415/g.10174 Transcript_5415/m.10174 type:complete len:578 (-) Transcript_5415:141-1874(-)